jgi:hypothetical protein
VREKERYSSSAPFLGKLEMRKQVVYYSALGAAMEKEGLLGYTIEVAFPFT